MAAIAQNGTTAALTLDARTQVGTTITTDGIYELSVDTSVLSGAERLLIEVERLFKSAGTYRVVDQFVIEAGRSNPGIVTIPRTLGYGLKYFVTQSAGTGRAFDWHIYQL